MDKARKPIDIVYIMGSGRSGSTLLSGMLGTQDGLFSAGEIYNYLNFFQSVDQHDRHCSCGARLDHCGFWHAVRQRVQASIGEELVDLKQTAGDDFIENNYQLLDAVRQESGCDIIVDSSKRHYRLDLMLASDLFTITIVHLVRDPRAYAYSSMLTEMKKGADSSVYYSKLLAWEKKNLAIRVLYGMRSGYVAIRYEDLVANSESQLNKVMQNYASDIDMSRFDDLSLMEFHEFSGNSRFREKGLSEISLDTRYIDKLSSSQWFNASLMTSPACAVFGYPILARRLPV